MRNFTGYFLVASKFGGLTRNPWTLSPFAPGNQKDSSGDIATCNSKALFGSASKSPYHSLTVQCVPSISPFSFAPHKASTEWGAETPPALWTHKSCLNTLLGYWSAIWENKRVFPSGVIAKSSLNPGTNLSIFMLVL